MNARREPVAYLDVRHSDAAASQHVAASERRRLGIPEQPAPKPLPVLISLRGGKVHTPPAPSPAVDQSMESAAARGGRTPTPPAPGRSPVSPPSPERGGGLSAEERGYVNEIVAAHYARRVLP